MKYFFLAFLLFIYSCGKNNSDSENSASAAMSPEMRTMTDEFMELINDHRASIGLSPLVHDDGLGRIARTHSENMADGSVSFGHTGFSARCSEGKDVMGGGNWCGENVAMGQKSVQAAFNSWMNSSGHRANIEKSNATHTGFGFKQSSSGSYYWTQIFLQVY